jgi:restriction system protein
MAVPSWIWFVEPVMRLLAKATAPVNRRELLAEVPLTMYLSPDELNEPAGAGRETKVRSRTGWALSYANLAGLVTSPARGVWTLSDAGRDTLRRYPDGIPEIELQEIRRARARTSGEDDRDDSAAPSTKPITPLPTEARSDATPAERLREAYAELRASMREELLTLIRNGSPEFFETLVLDLLHALGYGTERTALAPTPAGADGGIDGVISLDKLGLEKVYIQAKRYAEDHPISRPTIQAFLGALAGRRASKGVFLTTSRFSREARDFAASASDSLVLVDGQQLAELMMDHGVGVTTKETLSLVSIDGDYFEDG